MTPFLQFILVLAIIILAAKFAGYISTLLNQPSVLGELVVGLILGPSLLNLLHLPFLDDHLLPEMIEHLAEVGVLLLMFVAGMELHLSELASNSKVSISAGIFGVIIPVLLGWGVGIAAGFQPDHAFFLGLTLGATSVSISAQTLIELKAIRSRVGLGLLGAAVFDDIIVILLLSSFLALQSGEIGLGPVALILVKMIVFLIISVLFGTYILPRLVHKVARLPVSQSILTLALVVMFLYGMAAELLGGMAAITGTFLAGLMFARSPEKERLERGINALSYGFFVPIFFVNIGLTVNTRELEASALFLTLAITTVAIIGKLIGAGFGSRLAGFTWLESAQLGAGMISRGEVGLILASVGVTEGLLSPNEFSAVLGTILISTLVTPPLLRFLFSRGKAVQRVKEIPDIKEIG